MKRLWFFALFFALLAGGIAQEDPAKKALRKAGDTLERAKSLCYDSLVTVFGDNGQKSEYKISVKLQKPNLGRAEVKGSAGTDILVADGKSLWQEIAAEGGYLESKQQLGAALVGNTGALKLVRTDPFFGAMLYKTFQDAESYELGEMVKVGDIACLVVSRQYEGGLTQKTWIGAEDGLIRKREWWSRFGDEQTLTMSEVRSNIKCGEPIDKSTFAYKPSPGMSRLAASAPDFEFTTIDGKTVKLSDYRGKVVLISFFGTW